MSDDKTRISAEKGEHYVALPAGFMLGKYRLDAVLGQGGFGITYKAWDASLNRAVAIKEYLPADVAIRIDGTTVSARSRNDADSFDWGLQRFLDEARALALFEEAPSIVRVHDYLQANGTAYMVMALIDGTSLSAVYRREAPLSEARLKAIVLPLLEGLQHVHQAGFLHRDIKPSNILIRANGQPVLIDFGAARQALSGKSRSLTSIFTPGYAPFEQYSSTGRQGPWTDIYALGATLYHGVTGQLPISAADRIPHDPLEPAARLAQGRYGKSFLAAIDHGMGVFEADRPQDVAVWGRMLRGEIAVPPPRPRTPSGSEAARPSWRRRALIGGGAVLAGLAIAGIGIAALPADLRLQLFPFFSTETPQERAQRLAEQARLAAEEAQRAQAAVEAEAKRRAAEEAQLKAEAEARLKAEEEAKRQAVEAQRRIEEAARARDEEAKRRAEEEVRRLAEEQRQRQRLIEEQNAARLAAEEARKKAEAELAEAQRQTAEAQRQAEALRQQAAAARAAAEAEAQRRAEADARAKAEAEAKRKVEAEAKAQADAKAKAEAEAKRKAEAEADAKRKAEAEAKAKAEQDAKRKAEAEAKAKAEQEAKRKAEAEAKAKAEAEARAKEEAARQVAATPAFRYAGSWTWTIDCPDTGRSNFFSYWSFHRIEGEAFDWPFSGRAQGTASGRITGDRMSFRQAWVSDDGNNFRASFTLTAASSDVFTGSGFVSGFPGGARDRGCTIKVARGF